MMTLRRNSVAARIMATTVIALALAPLAYLTNTLIKILMYLKFGLMIVATFLARFGAKRYAAFWFGFSVFGWAQILFCIPGAWNSWGMTIFPGVNLFFLSMSIADQVAEDMSKRPDMDKLVLVVEVWLLLLSAVFGGLLAVALDRRSGRRNDRDGQVYGLDQTSPS